MLTLTKPQRHALKRKFEETELWRKDPSPTVLTGFVWRRLSYRQFRQTVQPGPGCIMVPWQGMWLGIEPDGYTHS